MLLLCLNRKSRFIFFFILHKNDKGCICGLGYSGIAVLWPLLQVCEPCYMIRKSGQKACIG